MIHSACRVDAVGTPETLVYYNMSVPETMVHGNDRCGCKKLIVMIGCSAARKTIAIIRLNN